jgi:hypothetical protein
MRQRRTPDMISPYVESGVIQSPNEWPSVIDANVTFV